MMSDLLTCEQAAKLLDPTGKLEITARSIQRHVAAGFFSQSQKFQKSVPVVVAVG